MMNTAITQRSDTSNIVNWLNQGQPGQIQIGHSFSTTSERSLDAHEHLYLSGDAQTHMYQILEGVVGIYNILPDGRRQIVTFCYPGDLIRAEHAKHFTENAEALSAARVRCIPVKAIDSLILNEPGFGQAMLNVLSSELAETREQLLSLGRKSALEKVATFLLRISKRNDREGLSAETIFVPMTRSEIADYLGLTIETVSRNITKLKTAKVIRLVSKSEIKVLDISALTRIAEGEG